MNKLKKNIYIPTTFIYCVVLLLIGLFLLFNNAVKHYKYLNATNLATLQSTNLKTGNYVVGYIDSYVTKNMINLGDGEPTGISQSYTCGTKEYDFYTINLCDNQYIQVMISNAETKKSLESMITNIDAKTYFEGKIISYPFEFDLQWFNDIDRNIYPNIDNISTKFVLQEINPNTYKDGIRAGIIIIILSFLLYIYKGKVHIHTTSNNSEIAN